MNFLAHLYLSGDDINIMTGNFMADAIKGNKYLAYKPEIQNGIRLHRAIDYFTDQHPTVRLSKSRLKSRYNHYNGVIIDIFYDHFLAKNWNRYSEIPLELFTQEIYKTLDKQLHILPSKVKRMYYFMKIQNWLLNYQQIDEVKKVLTQMNYRSKYTSNMHLAIEDLTLNYTDFEDDFNLFFPQIITFTNQKINQF